MVINEFEVTIPGLNARQRCLADIIWQFESRSQINTFIRSLPTVQLQDEARTIVNLMIISALEQTCDGDDPMPEAQDLIRKVSK